LLAHLDALLDCLGRHLLAHLPLFGLQIFKASVLRLLQYTFALTDAQLNMMSALGKHIPYPGVIYPVGRATKIIGRLGAGLDTLHYRLFIGHLATSFLKSLSYNRGHSCPHSLELSFPLR